MITITKHGNPDGLKVQFKCNRCGCVFESDTKSCKFFHTSLSSSDDLFYCDCPECGRKDLRGRIIDD